MGLVSACPEVTTGWVGILKWVGALQSRKALTTLLSIGTAVLCMRATLRWEMVGTTKSHHRHTFCHFQM